MAKMGGSPPHFEGKNFAYWKVRMAAYLDAIAPELKQEHRELAHKYQELEFAYEAIDSSLENSTKKIW